MSDPSAFSAVLTRLDKTILDLTMTRSQLGLSLRLAEALLKLNEVDSNLAVSEEALLGYCLLRKLLKTS